MSRYLSPLKNNYENSISMPHHIMSHHISLLKIILKIQENHLMLHHLSLLKNNSKNLGNMSHHLMLCHISPLKSDSENSRKSSHPTSDFSIKK
jgi:hypothetical protein